MKRDWVADNLDYILGKVEKARKKEQTKTTFAVNTIDKDDERKKEELLGRLKCLGYKVEMIERYTWKGLTTVLEQYLVEW